MRKVILLMILVFFAFSCSKAKKTTSDKVKKTEKKTEKKFENKETKTEKIVHDKDKLKIDKNKVVAPKEGTVVSISDDRKKIVDFAKSFEDKKIPKSNKWNKYASGFIKMVYLKFAVNLTDVDKKKDDNGKWLTTTQMIYNYIEKNGEILKGNNPKPGDIVFFDNTYDADKDEVFNDKLTSIGLVIDTDKEGTIYFLYNTSKGVKLKMINFKHPEQKNIKNKNITKTINSQMRWLTKKEKKNGSSDKFPTLSSQLVNSFGSILSKHKLSDLAYNITLPEAERENIAKFAKTFEDKNMPESKKWNKYASGFVKMVFLNKRVDLTDVENKKDDSGKWLSTTEMIYNYVNTNGKLYKENPKVGDIVFFDNTFDKDKDKEFNDKLTSIGVVVEIDNEGTIYFLYKTSKGVKLRMMNLKHPEQEEIKNKNITKTINSKMRWLNKKEKEDENNKKYELASQLLNSFGSIYK